MNVWVLASFLLGFAIGLVSASIFALILERVAKSSPRDAIRLLQQLIAYALGGGLTDYVIFDFVLRSGAIAYYILGFTLSFIPMGLWIFIDWRRR